MAKKKLTYKEAMAEVEQTLVRLRSGELGVDELTSAVARASELIVECRAMLIKAETEVERLINPEA